MKIDIWIEFEHGNSRWKVYFEFCVIYCPWLDLQHHEYLQNQYWILEFMLPNQKDLKLFLRLSVIIRSEIKFNLLQITLDFSKESSFWSWKQILILEKYLNLLSQNIIFET